jgi:hypothetical protein
VQHWSDKADTGRVQDAMGAAILLAGAGAMDLARRDLRSDAYTKAERRKLQTRRRVQWLQGVWSDRARFEAIVASGRYLKLCALLEWAAVEDEIADWRLERIADAAMASRARAVTPI